MPKNGKLANITRETLGPVWARKDIPVEKIAASLGVSDSALYLKARKLGLPKRGPGNPRKCSDDEFKDMWAAGVSSKEIAAHFGYSQHPAVHRRRRSLNLPPRGRGAQPPMTLAQYLEQQLGERMREV